LLQNSFANPCTPEGDRYSGEGREEKHVRIGNNSKKEVEVKPKLKRVPSLEPHAAHSLLGRWQTAACCFLASTLATVSKFLALCSATF
jgi:hypothetical protein